VNAAQHDRVSPRFGRGVVEFLYENYYGRSLERGGPVPWPLQSPNLSALDFFRWGCFKSRVYHNGKPEAWQQLVQAINEAAVGCK
jgi:hypothetical protein